MTGREVINSKLVQIRKYLFFALFIIPIMFCLALFFSKHSAFNILSIFFPIAIGLSYNIWLIYRTISVPCPFCDKKISWDFQEYDFRLLSNDYKYCPYCRTEFDEQVNEGSKKSSSDNLQKIKVDKRNEKSHMTGRDVINANISKIRFKCLIASIAIFSVILGFYWWVSINGLYLVWMISLGYCLIVKLYFNASSWTACPFCEKRICSSLKENDKWKLGRDFLFCQRCGASIDQQFHE